MKQGMEEKMEQEKKLEQEKQEKQNKIREKRKLKRQRQKQRQKEKRDDNNKYLKEYYCKNKQKVLQKMKQKYICACGKKSTIGHKKRHEHTKKHIQFIQSQN